MIFKKQRLEFSLMASLFYSCLIIVANLFFSCSNIKDNIQGEWISFNDFSSPALYTIKEDILTYRRNSTEYKYLYKIKGDTLLVAMYNDISKSRYIIENSILTSYDIETDSILGRFIRYTPGSFLDHLNSELKLKISLPVVQGEKIIWDDWGTDMLIVDLNDSNDVILYFNGTKLSADSNLYSKLYEKTKYYPRENCYCIYDKDLSVKDLNIVEKELRKAQLLRIKYLLNDESKNILSINYNLPSIEYSYPIGFWGNKPPLPQMKLSDHYSKLKSRYLIEIYKGSIFINCIKSSLDSITCVLSNHKDILNGPMVYVYFEENIKYQEYLDYLSKIVASMKTRAENTFYPYRIYKDELNDIKKCLQVFETKDGCY